MHTKAFRAAAVLPLLISSAAFGHPGHGSSGGGYELTHYLTEPLHLGAGLAILFFAVLTALWLRARRRLRWAGNPKV